MLDFVVSNIHDVMFAISFGSITCLILLETIKPRRKNTEQQLNRWVTNITLALLNFFLVTSISVLISSSSWVNSIRLFTPILHYFELNEFSEIIITIFVFDLAAYCFHRLMHISPILWRIHAVHHCDTAVDATTTLRSHIFEPLLSLIIFMFIIILLGPSMITIIIYNIFHTIISIISHSNIYMPKSFEKYLSYFIITPDFHRLHHASNQKYTDSNYGILFPWFDHIFASATKIAFKEQETIELGLSYFRKPSDSRVDRLLLLPFVWKK